MQKNYFIAQENSRYSVRTQDWFFLLFLYCLFDLNEMFDLLHHFRREETLTKIASFDPGMKFVRQIKNWNTLVFSL